MEFIFPHIFFPQTMLTLIVKLYKTISIKYNLKQNITLLNSIAHGFLNILTADMKHDLKMSVPNHLLKVHAKCQTLLTTH